MDGRPVCDPEAPCFQSRCGSAIKSDLADTSTDQSGSVQPSGWHLVTLNLGLNAPYPISCHLAFDNQSHMALTTTNANSGTFNITNVADPSPQIFGLSTSIAAAASAAATSSTTSIALAAATSNGNNTNTSGGTSAGAIAGIVIGVVVGVGIVLGALIFLCLRQRRRNRRRRGGVQTATGNFGGEMASDQKQQSELPAEPQPAVEKDGVQQPAELPAEGEPEGPVEMEGSTTFIGRLRGLSLKR